MSLRLQSRGFTSILLEVSYYEAGGFPHMFLFNSMSVLHLFMVWRMRELHQKKPSLHQVKDVLLQNKDNVKIWKMTGRTDWTALHG